MLLMLYKTLIVFLQTGRGKFRSLADRQGWSVPQGQDVGSAWLLPSTTICFVQANSLILPAVLARLAFTEVALNAQLFLNNDFTGIHLVLFLKAPPVCQKPICGRLFFFFDTSLETVACSQELSSVSCYLEL